MTKRKRSRSNDNRMGEISSAVAATGNAGAADYNDEQDNQDLKNILRATASATNRKKSGGFQSLGLCYSVLRGIKQKGYKIPTPIQRKTLPLIMDGRDVVAMARTGSGKTAAFLIPMFERLKSHSSTGARAMVLSPTRELALQTHKFAKELGKFTTLRSAVILGGDAIEDQFAAIHENPDIIIATPGRLMHILVEMNLKLNTIEYIVFDEADRLFEMGFQEQMQEILKRLRETRQTLLFSATLPQLLVEFAKAGLHDPVLVRLDVDTKLSADLRLSFLRCRNDDKLAVLMYLLRAVVKSSELTMVFAATRHHVDYLATVLSEAQIPCSHSYGALDPTARKINVARFRSGITKVMIVTDLAARGIDIPLLDNVINFNFPPAPKLFIHRVGRVARAGRSGTAYSLVSAEEEAYLFDLHMFLGRPIKLAKNRHVSLNAENSSGQPADGMYGCVPQSVIDSEDERLRVWHERTELESGRKVSNNAYKHYCRTRPAASSESIRRVKEMMATAANEKLGLHPMFCHLDDGTELDRTLEALKNFRAPTTIFEINASNKNRSFEVMRSKRHADDSYIARRLSTSIRKPGDETVFQVEKTTVLEDSSDALASTFNTVIAPRYQEKRAKLKRPRHESDNSEAKKLSTGTGIKDEAHFVPSLPKNYASELGLSLGGSSSSFAREAGSAVLDFTADDEKSMQHQKRQKVWDRRRKRFVTVQHGAEGGKQRRNESGAKIGSTGYKRHLYRDWVEKNKVDHDDDEDSSGKPTVGRFRGKRGSKFQRRNQGDNRLPNEMKGKDQILKQRRTEEQKKFMNRKRSHGKLGKGMRKGESMRKGEGHESRVHRRPKAGSHVRKGGQGKRK